jgi:hypothetical protein
MAQVAELSKGKALSLNPTTTHTEMETKAKKSDPGHTWKSSLWGRLDHRK